ncbi:2Fe-2S iron-sulfur cluster binding domain-containing protein [Iamia sp. SCSIO 61187]|uniref:(2Fe-2S)-binding protein n=1 Tax=Iamia sp. SCSIO 61187 TaxID=2722752 RepID=UPI001C63A5E1|nr:2Fe-2S iron-sulfur cluster-binding protein [Iamia sp. SCSIO 61187]QYG94047.1 2Fe-2S iron-sulfur cluster binding domain-containing protein [Iamia sp. SCSIO 61187]
MTIPPTETAATPVTVRVGDEALPVPAAPSTTLLDVLRGAGRTEVKEACGEGRCGACAVLVDGEMRLACIELASRAVGCSVTTAGSAGCAPAREALAATGAIQCGFCTPAAVIALTWAADGRAGVDDALGSLICRCGCHVGFREAAARLGLGVDDGTALGSLRA